ncbi:ATP-binding cassette domain-containing protein [Salinarchaeum sp. IM2453]|uniref:ABC transporter ATP-binding protein n=1 Tax=Salinarchaeum sp. IM2453 TaxID=2862870 RepID=UPI001C835954|nr:oligopeptide/dipeptide ABC transporter ATP-binding protein [Salinarchaeum sp. IM2453]QZA88969.1 ATP-binding cassette domain-containing protein [Salinarchaeum sp. IM2453]
MSREVTKPRDEKREDEDVLVQVRNLKTYYDDSGLLDGTPPVKAVDGVSFDIKKGETLGLVGESGCGKTTLGRTLLQLEDATAGEIKFDGTDITTLRGDEIKQWRRNAQMVFQDPDSSLNDRMTVGEIIREPLDVYDWKSKKERRERVKELLDTVGLKQEHYFRYPHQFSGGQRQRIGIARTLTLEPDFIVLDEPVSALDVSVQAEILNLLKDLQDEFDLTYLFIAHDLSVVKHISDRVAVMYLGNVMEIGPVDEIFEDPAHPYTHSLLSAIPRPDPTAESNRITLRGTPPSPRYPPNGCPFSDRCPARIRPKEYKDVDEDLWNKISILWTVIKERNRADRTVTERIKELLGGKTRFGSIDEIYEEVFDGRDMPEKVATVLDEVAEYVRDHEEQKALDLLNQEFGSICDRFKDSWTRNVVSEIETQDSIQKSIAVLLEETDGIYDDLEEQEAKSIVEDVQRHLENEQREQAVKTVAEAVGGAYDPMTEEEINTPRLHNIGDKGRKSMCHRHLSRYRDPDEVLEERY